MSSRTLSARLMRRSAPPSALRPSCAARTVNIPFQQRRHGSYTHLYEELPQRRIPLIYDDLAPLSAHRLSVSLRSFLPAGWVDESKTLPEKSSEKDLPPAYHLVYFNPTISSEELLPDGTDPLQSPGPPFVRRMWAGGYLRFNLIGEADGLKLDGERYVCMEGIRNVQIKGKEGDEKVFVGIERRMAPVGQADNEDRIREKLWREEEEDFGEAALIERRNIVFMRERTPEQLKAAAAASRASEKMLKGEWMDSFCQFPSQLERRTSSQKSSKQVLYSTLAHSSSTTSLRFFTHTSPHALPPIPLQRPNLQRALHPPRPPLLPHRRRPP